MIILIDAEKSFDKMQFPSLIKKTLESLGMVGWYLIILKAMYDKPIVTSMLNEEKNWMIPTKIRSRTRQGCPLSLFLLNIVLARIVIKKGVQLGRKKVKTLLFANNTILCMVTFDKGKYQISNEFTWIRLRLPSRETISKWFCMFGTLLVIDGTEVVF